MEIITSRANERVKIIARLCDSEQKRAESGMCVVHGIKLCMEVKRLGGELAELWFTEAARGKYASQLAELELCTAKTVTMSDSVCEKLSPQRSPQGVLAVVALPQKKSVDAHGQLGMQNRLLVLCSVQDPANVGAMFRTAAALGFGGVVLSNGCADPFSPKALRASMGAVYSVPLAYTDCELKTIETLKVCGYSVIATALTDKSMDISNVPKSGKMAILIGNEGTGLCAETIESCDITAVIPITDRVESLNAASAAAIAMWVLRT
ncbi:MAG: RNA methyltransferase [Oscillospiraceae bacterium]